MGSTAQPAQRLWRLGYHPFGLNDNLVEPHRMNTPSDIPTAIRSQATWLQLLPPPDLGGFGDLVQGPKTPHNAEDRIGSYKWLAQLGLFYNPARSTAFAAASAPGFTFQNPTALQKVFDEATGPKIGADQYVTELSICLIPDGAFEAPRSRDSRVLSGTIHRRGVAQWAETWHDNSQFDVTSTNNGYENKQDSIPREQPDGKQPDLVRSRDQVVAWESIYHIHTQCSNWAAPKSRVDVRGAAVMGRCERERPSSKGHPSRFCLAHLLHAARVYWQWRRASGSMRSSGLGKSYEFSRNAVMTVFLMDVLDREAAGSLVLPPPNPRDLQGILDSLYTPARVTQAPFLSSSRIFQTRQCSLGSARWGLGGNFGGSVKHLSSADGQWIQRDAGSSRRL
ncbi:hypothetical protein G7046_g1577 [Stylonectria norvegica]|nr:hypothetical protein G7046_g1577 [Stylonectria norvegica]